MASEPMSQSESLKPFDVDDLAQEIRRVNGSNSLGAGALAEALGPFISARIRSALATTAGEADMLPALKAAEHDLGATYETLKQYNGSKVSIGMWGRLRSIRNVIANVEAHRAALVTDKG